MTARYFTHKSGKFQDNCLAVKFDRDGRCWFVRDDDKRTLVACRMWTLQDAIRNVETCAWIEVTEQYVMTPELLDKPMSKIDAW